MATKKHPADESFDSPPKSGMISNAEGLPQVREDAPVSTGKTEDVKPNAGSAAVPRFEEPTPRKGTRLPGSDDRRTGAGANDPIPTPERPDGF